MQDSILVVVGLIAAASLALLIAIGRMYRKVGPNQALIIFGFRGSRVVRSGGAVIFPVIESYRELSLELMSFDVTPDQDLYSNQKVAISVEAVAQIKVKGDETSILTAAEQFLSKTIEERQDLIKLVVSGHLRGIIGTLAVEDILTRPDEVATKIRDTCVEDMSKMGLEVVSFTIKDVSDKNGFIENMGRPDIARIQRDADIAAAEAERDTAIKRAAAEQDAAIARAKADQESVVAQKSSETFQAQAERDRAIKVADYEAESNAKQAEADKAYELQTAITEQKVVTEKAKVMLAEKEGATKVQEAEVLRREAELKATVLKAAEAEKTRLQTEAEGRAAAIKAEGEAEANIIQLKGKAEADAMTAKATAYDGWGQAAIADRMITSMPQIIREMAQPLGNIDRITVVSTGSDGNVGMSKITKDMTNVLAQAPQLIESLTGIKMDDVMAFFSGAKAIPSTGKTVEGHIDGAAAAPAEPVIEPATETVAAS